MRDVEIKFMMRRIKAMKSEPQSINLARDYAKYTLKHNILHEYLLGFGTLEIEMFDENKKPVFREDIVMNSLYEQHGLNRRVGKKVNKAFLKAIKTYKASSSLLRLMELLKYQMSREQENKAVFKLNFKKLMKALKKDIRINNWRYFTNFDRYGKTGILPQLQEYNEYFKQFGYCFLVD